MSDTIERIMVTFFDIIYSSNRVWSQSEIHSQLVDRGYSISQSQLNRDLNRYHHYFEVERLDKDNSYYGNPVYRRKKNRLNESKMSHGEMKFLNALRTIMGHVNQYLPPEAEHFLDSRMEIFRQQRDILYRNVPHHPMFNLEKQLELLAKHAAQGAIDPEIAAGLRVALIKSQEVCVTSSEYASKQDTFCPIKVYEEQGELIVTGMSAFEGGSNRNYRVGKLLAISNITVRLTQDSQIMKMNHR